MSLLAQQLTLLTGKHDPPFPACTAFQPTVLEGQLCYSLNVSKVNDKLNHKKVKRGIENGLLLILDPGKNDPVEQDATTKWDMSLRLKQSSQEKNSVRVYLNTLDRFSGYKAGSYAMSSLKTMLVTDNFLGLPDETKACQVETYEECHAERYLTDCGCVPWALSGALEYEVSI
jgi:hypothetical protein